MIGSTPSSATGVSVLVVDDSPVQRRFLRHMIDADPELTVVGEARTGREACVLTDRLRPAVVLMDLDLPEMNGIEAIECIMASLPTPIVVLSAFVAGPDNANGLAAMAAGAVDIVAKPTAEEAADLEAYAESLRRRLRVASRARVITHPRGRLKSTSLSGIISSSAHPAPTVPAARTVEPVRAPAGPVDHHRPVELIAIGVSTGGPQALATLLGALPETLTQAVLVVQHMADGFLEGLAQWLDSQCALPVSVGEGGKRLLSGRVTLAPGGLNLIVHERLRVTCEVPPPSQFHIPGIDPTFASIAHHLGPAAIGVILTGMGRDGALGLKEMRDCGAATVGQDEATSAVYGMPAAAMALGGVEHERPLLEIAPLLLSLVDPPGAGRPMKLDMIDSDFARLTRFLHDAAGLVFDDTRRDSLGYALGERLPKTTFTEITPYLDHVLSSEGAQERQQLLDEVTIPETYFFRNPPQIRALGRQVLPELVRTNADTKRLVIWSAGCSTGEEAYTVAMLLIELIPDHKDWDIRIVATDVSQRALAAARRGRYGQRSVQLADAERVGRFFDYDHGDYVVKPEVRALVQFRHHNLVTDPSPFLSREIDIVLCRNVTIYFNRETTRGLMERFHQSLNDGGYLFLGHAETLWQITDAFTLVTLGDAFVYRRIDPPKVERKIGLGALKVFGWRSAQPEVPEQAVSAEAPSLLTRLQIPFRAADVAPSAAIEAPADYQPSLQLVHAELAAGRYVLAAEMAESLAARDPLLAEAHYLRGMALCNQGRDRDALESLRKAVFLDPDTGFAHFLLAGALARLGEDTAAARAYRAAADTLGRRPGDAVAAELGGRSLSELIVLCRSLAGTVEKRARQQEMSGGR